MCVGVCMKHVPDDHGKTPSRTVDELRQKRDQEDERLTTLRHNKQQLIAQVRHKQ